MIFNKNKPIMFTKILLSLSTVMLTSCSNILNFELNSKCNSYHKQSNFYDSSLYFDYEKEKGFYLIQDKMQGCYLYCNLLQKNERWDYIEVYLTKKVEPIIKDAHYYTSDKIYNTIAEKDAFYRYSRDYTLKKCLSKEQYPIYRDNLFKNSKGDFCITAEEIQFPKAKIKFITKNKKFYISYGNYTEGEYKVSINEKTLVSFKYLSYFYLNGSGSCTKDDSESELVLKDFRYF